MSEKTSMNEYKQKIKAFMSDFTQVAKKKWWLYIVEVAVIAVILIADLLSKKYAWAYLETQPGLEHSNYVKGLFNLSYVRNTGGGFGIFQDSTVALTVLTFIILVVLGIYLIFSLKESEWLRISLVFIFAGGIGNNVDRIKFGYVRDFIQFAFWEDFPVFNIADSFITVGVFMLIVVLIVMLVQEGKKNQQEFEKEQAGVSKAQEEGVDPLDAPIPLNPMMKSKNDYTFETSDQTGDKSEDNKQE